MKTIKVLALYRGKLFEPRGTSIRITHLLQGMEHEPSIELSVFTWNKTAEGFARHFYLDNNHAEDVKKLRRYIKENNIDVVIGYTASALYYLMPLKFLTKAKIAFETHGFIEDEARAYNNISIFKYWLLKIFFGISYFLCDLIMTSDGPSVGAVMERYNSKTILLTGGVDLAAFNPQAQSGGYIKKDGRIVIGYAGNARTWQGVDFLIGAFRKISENHKDFRLAMLMSEKKDYGPDIEVYGPVPNEDVPKFLCDCDILVIPRPDTPVTKIAYPSKLSEYLAMGKAVVGSNVGDMDKIIQSGENGLIFRAGDQEGLVLAVLSLRDAEMRARLGQEAWKTAQGLSWNKLVKELVDVLHKLV